MFKMDFRKDGIDIEFIGNLAITPHQTITFNPGNPWRIKVDRVSKVKYDDCCLLITEPKSSVTIMYSPSSDLTEKDWIHLIPARDDG